MRGVPVCEACGYDLRGVGLDGRQTPCPECGAWFTAQSPFIARAWFPAVLWAIAGLCGPTAAVLALAVWLGRGASADPSLGMLMAALFLMWPVAAVAVPAWVAGKLVRRRVLRARRTRVGVAIALGAVAANIVISIAVLAWVG
jgi:hypothetical protein